MKNKPSVPPPVLHTQLALVFYVSLDILVESDAAINKKKEKQNKSRFKITIDMYIEILLIHFAIQLKAIRCTKIAPDWQTANMYCNYESCYHQVKGHLKHLRRKHSRNLVKLYIPRGDQEAIAPNKNTSFKLKITISISYKKFLDFQQYDAIRCIIQHH